VITVKLHVHVESNINTLLAISMHQKVTIWANSSSPYTLCVHVRTCTCKYCKECVVKAPHNKLLSITMYGLGLPEQDW
jgi:hypothetical protein